MFPCFRVLIILYMNPWKSQVAQATLIHVCMENILHPKKCSLPDTLSALQRPPPVRSARREWSLVSSADRCSVSSVRACVPVYGLPWYLSRPGFGTACPAACAVQSVRVRWGLGLHLWGIWGEPGVGWVDSLRRKKSKKAFLLKWWRFTTPSFLRKSPPPLLPISKISHKNKKTPTKGLCSVLYLPYKP